MICRNTSEINLSLNYLHLLCCLHVVGLLWESTLVGSNLTFVLTLSSCILARSRDCCLATAFFAQFSTLSVYTSSRSWHCCWVETAYTARAPAPHSCLSTSSWDVFSRNFSSSSFPSKGGTCTWRVVSGVAVLSRALGARDGRFVRERLKEDKLPWLGLLGRRGEAWKKNKKKSNRKW